MAVMPSNVRIREVGPRDGFQNEPETIASADKVRLIDLLSATGVGRIEVTSFVRPDVIPQLSDAAEVLAAVQRREGVISTSFGCPYEGEVPPQRVFAIAERLIAAGCDEVAFGDTTGMANPRQVREFFAAARERLTGVELTAHFHNTRGQGLANVLAALEEGVESFESSFGELGGCPVPPGSTGNVGSEDVVSMLHEMGVGTGIDLPRLIEASRAAQELLGRPLGAHVLRAGPVDWHRG